MGYCGARTDEKVEAALRAAIRHLNRDPEIAAGDSGSHFPAHMNLRSTLVWFLLLFLAVMNGGLRDALLTPRLGEFGGHIASTIVLCAAMLVVTWLTIGWIRPAKSTEALLIGGGWVLMTVAFEFLAGHYVFRTPWARLLADYNLVDGRIWLLVLATSAFAPLIMARARNLL
jgi:hypothetical protein